MKICEKYKFFFFAFFQKHVVIIEKK